MQAALDDCSAALRDEPCALGTRPKAAREARRAVVVVREAGGRISVWVHHGDATTSYRELLFDAKDALSERLRAAGLVAASMLLVPESTSAPPPEPEPEVASAKRLMAKPVAGPSIPPPRRYWAALLNATASNWAPDAPWIVGGTLGFEALPLLAPVGMCLTVDLGRGLGRLDESTTISRGALAVGLFAMLPARARLRLTFRGQVAREVYWARGTSAAGEVDSGATWRSGGLLALAPTWMLQEDLSVHAGAQLSLYAGAPRVISGTRTLAQAGRVTLSGFAGIRLAF